ncbi:MAG: hypothetical protein JHD16_04635 [Solirubrobacteraceae bacterium]|nr:hypothetical protein [Solirubrobacteraceae bacterium]
MTGLLAAGCLTAAQPAAAANAGCGTTYGFASDETFFTGANLGATSAPGELAACRKVQIFDDRVPTGTRVYQVIYRSENEAGTAIPVSGTVLVPPTGGTGIISLASGTIGLADKIGNTKSCAPSVGLPDGGAFVSGTAARYLTAGYAVAVTDYEGLRTPGAHPYLNGWSAGKSMIDVARAARNLPYESLGGDTKTLFTGYSQGGHATLWAAQLAPYYAPTLPVAGAVAGASPVNLEAVRQNLNGALASGLYSYMITSLNGQFPELNLLSKLSSSGQSFMNALATKCSPIMASNITGWFRTWSSLWKTGQDPINDPAFVARASQSNVPGWGPQVPVFMFHGDNDGIIPIGPHKALADAWIAADLPVEWRTVPGSHLWDTNANGQDASDTWIADRFSE